MAMYYNGVKVCRTEVNYSASGLPIEVSTASDLTSRILITNVNKIYHYIGETNATYTNNHYYSLIEVSVGNYQFKDLCTSIPNVTTDGNDNVIFGDFTHDIYVGTNDYSYQTDCSVYVYNDCTLKFKVNDVLQTIEILYGDAEIPNLSPENIKAGVTILGVTGTYTGN